MQIHADGHTHVGVEGCQKSGPGGWWKKRRVELIQRPLWKFFNSFTIYVLATSSTIDCLLSIFQLKLADSSMSGIFWCANSLKDFS